MEMFFLKERATVLLANINGAFPDVDIFCRTAGETDIDFVVLIKKLQE